MMYYWVVKHDGSEDQDIVSYREDLGALRQHHIIVESLSPLLNCASFALNRRISTEKTWRDLNDTLVVHLQSQRIQDSKEESALGVNIGTNRFVQSRGTLIHNFSRYNRGIQEPNIAKREGVILQIARGNILRCYNPAT